MQTEVVNVKNDEYDVYIGRGMRGRARKEFWEESRWANPFRVGKGGFTRELSIQAYRKWLTKKLRLSPGAYHELFKLEGKQLGCWCAPEACHGDILVEYLEVARSLRQYPLKDKSGRIYIHLELLFQSEEEIFGGHDFQEIARLLGCHPASFTTYDRGCYGTTVISLGQLRVSEALVRKEYYRELHFDTLKSLLEWAETYGWAVR